MHETRSLDALYRLPFEVLEHTSGKVRNVVASAKLSAGRLDRNRYYVDLTELDPGRLAEDLATLARELGLPEAAGPHVREALERFRVVRFLGAGPSHGRMTYRLYFGFSQADEETGNSAVSIDWVPWSQDFLIKTYDELQAIPRSRETALLQECLGSGGAPAGLAATVYDVCVRVTGKARGALHVTHVREPGGSRSSVAFNYYRCAYTATEDLQAELDELAAAFRIPPEEHRVWLRDTAHLRIIDVAAGLGWDGEPFVTIYHGFLSEPPPYLPDRVSSPLRIAASSCGCPRLVYAVGEIGIDFPSPARRDAIAREIGGDPADPARLLTFLEAKPWYAASIVWTLRRGPVPIYALEPGAAFAAPGYARLGAIFRAQRAGGAGPAVVPGLIVAEQGLRDGSTLPVVRPELRGLSTWELPRDERWRATVLRLQGELDNRGLRPDERAMNFAATFLLRSTDAFAEAAAEGMELRSITARPSPIARPGSEAWDVRLTFFHPTRRFERALLVQSVTVDVGDQLPVARGPWHRRKISAWNTW
jgi:hypothetical protein